MNSSGFKDAIATSDTGTTQSKPIGRKKEFLPKKQKPSSACLNATDFNSDHGDDKYLHQFNVPQRELSNENVYGEIGDFSVYAETSCRCRVGHCQLHDMSSSNWTSRIIPINKGAMDDAGPSHLKSKVTMQTTSQNHVDEITHNIKENKQQNCVAECNHTNDTAQEKLLYHVDAPKPLEYKLRNKRQRNVYHSITLKSENYTKNDQREFAISSQQRNLHPPPVPYKPHYLRAGYSGLHKPPIPPRIINQDAMLQRKQLNEEYFENIRRNVDGDFVGICDDVVISSNVLHNQTIQNTCTSSDVHQVKFSKLEHPYQIVDNNTGSVQKRFSAPLLDCNQESSLSANANLCRTQSSGSLNLVYGISTSTVPKSTSDWMQSLKSLKLCGWYWGDMTWEEAELMLDQKPEEIGLFLLRDSQDPLHILTVTVRTAHNSIRHVRIEHTNGKFQLYDPDHSTSRGAADCVRHHNIVTFLKLAMKHSQNGNFLYFVRPQNMGEPPVQIQLLKPISRFSTVKSLKYYSRFVLRDYFPLESVEKLPLPVKLKEYLCQSHYFDKDEDLKCSSFS